jgi:pyruvate,orthophosphate dikinase
VLNIGLNDVSVEGLAQQSGDERFAWDSYRRLLAMFGKTVLDIEGTEFEHKLDEAKATAGVATDIELPASALKTLVNEFKTIIKNHTHEDFPQDPQEQLTQAVRAVFASWNTDRARLYRRQEHIAEELGTAVNVQAMVFGNVGEDSGTGVAFTRDPGSGDPGVYGDYLPKAQGEDVVAGIRNAFPLEELQRLNPPAYTELMQIMTQLEQHYRDLCDIEFTVERGKL